MPTFPTPRDALFGNPPTANHQPDKNDLRAVLEQMQTMFAAGTIKGFAQSVATLPGTGNVADDLRIVVALPQDGGGVYEWSGSAWALVAALPVIFTTDEYALLAQAWAESVTSPDGETGSKSAKTWAQEASTSEANASNSATSAAASSAAAGVASGRLVITEFAQLATDFVYSSPGAGQQAVTAGDVVVDEKTGNRWEVLASGASGATLDYTGSGGVKFAALVSDGGSYSAAQFAGASDTAKVDAAIAKAGTGGFVVVPSDMSPDWSAVTFDIDVTVTDVAGGRIIPGNGPALEGGSVTGGGAYAVFRPPVEKFSYLYVMPRGEGYRDEGYPAAVKVFGRDYIAGIRLDGVSDTAHVDYPVAVFGMQGLAGVHGGRSILASKVTNDFGPVHPDWHIYAGNEATLGALRVGFMEPQPVPAGPYDAGGGRIELLKGAAWTPNFAVTQGDRAMVYGRVYEACESGTTGSTPMTFDEVGGRVAYARGDGTLTTQGTPETIGSWSGYTGSDGSIKWAFIVDSYYSSGWSAWRQHVMIGDPAVEAIPGTGLYGQFTSSFAFRTGDDLIGINPATGDQVSRLSFDNTLTTLEHGATAGAATNARLAVGDTAIYALGRPLLIGSAVNKPDGATTLALTGDQRRINFNDSTATNFTGFTGLLAGVEYKLLFSTGNTTLVNGTGIRIAGGSNITPGQYSFIVAVAVTATQVYITASS